jgi:hypothetical protein
MTFPGALEESKIPVEASNYNVCSYAGTLYRTNTNNFKGYAFTKIESTILDGSYIETDLIPTLITSQWTEGVQGTPVPRVALTTERKTDILLVKARQWPAQFYNSFHDGKNKVQAAWFSLSEILGKAIALREDIEPNEISVGIRYESSIGQFGNKEDLWAVFIADNLDNGSGYSSNYSTQAAFEELLDYAEMKIKPDFCKKQHSTKCLSSCYDCLKHYSNRFNHNLLDWKLGLDLLGILRGVEPSLAMTESHWVDSLGLVYAKLLSDFRLGAVTVETIDEFTLLRLNNSVGEFGVVPLHPLANRDVLNIELLNEELSEKLDMPIVFSCPFDLERNPLSEIHRIGDKVRSLLKATTL